MIEAQAVYITNLIKKVKAARNAGGSLKIQPRPAVVKDYNQEIQARLSKSAFADPNCNSWYKNDAGLITNNWSDSVIPYQKRTSSINWDDFEISGTLAENLKREGKVAWSRVVEETQVSNAAIVAGMLSAAAAVSAVAFYRKSLSKSFRR